MSSIAIFGCTRAVKDCILFSIATTHLRESNADDAIDTTLIISVPTIIDVSVLKMSEKVFEVTLYTATYTMSTRVFPSVVE